MSDTGRKTLEWLKVQGKYLAFLFLYDPLWEKIKPFFLSPRYRQARRVTAIVLAVVIISFLVLPSPVQASIVNEFGTLLAIIASAFAWVLGIVARIFNWTIVDPVFNTIVASEAVRIGWKATRDVADLAMVLVLLGIGFATILRVPTYHIKKLIIPFIVALLLINFSKLICGVITDFCRVIMWSFNSAIQGDNYSGAIASALRLDDWFRGPDAQTANATSSDYWRWAESLVVLIVFLLGLIFAFLLLVALMISRWITLIILTIFSPLVYAAMILPTTKKFASSWWQQFLQNAFYGPVAVFMVYLAIVIVRHAGSLGGTGGGPRTFNTQTALALVVAIVVLYKAVTFSRNMGIGGAKAIISTGTKWGKGALGAAGAGLAGITGIAALTEGAKAAWQKRQEAVHAARKERGERIGVSEPMRWTMPSLALLAGKPSKAMLKSRQAQEGFRMKQEKEAADRLNAEMLTDAKLSKDYKGSGGYDRMVLGREMARRGLLDRGQFSALRKDQQRGGSRSGLARLDDAMKSSRPMDYWDETGTAQTHDECVAQLRKMDPKKIHASQLGDTRFIAQLAQAKDIGAVTDLRKRDDESRVAIQQALAHRNVLQFKNAMTAGGYDMSKLKAPLRKLRTEATDIDPGYLGQIAGDTDASGAYTLTDDELSALYQMGAPDIMGKTLSQLPLGRAGAALSPVGKEKIKQMGQAGVNDDTMADVVEEWMRTQTRLATLATPGRGRSLAEVKASYQTDPAFARWIK